MPCIQSSLISLYRWLHRQTVDSSFWWKQRLNAISPFAAPDLPRLNGCCWVPVLNVWPCGHCSPQNIGWCPTTPHPTKSRWKPENWKRTPGRGVKLLEITKFSFHAKFRGVYHWNLSWVDIRITFQITIDLYTGHRTEICWVLLKVASWVTCHTFMGTGCQRNIPQHRHLYLTSLVSRMPRSCGRELHAVLGSSNSRVGSAQVQTPQLTTEWSLCSWSGCQHVFLQHVGHGGNHWHDGLSSGETIDSRIGADIEAAFLTARKRHRSAAWLTCLPDAEKNHCDSKLQKMVHKFRSPQKPHPNVCHSLNQTRTKHPKSEPWGGYPKSASSNRLSCRTRGSFNQHRNRYILKAIKVEQVTSPGSAGYFLSTLGFRC